QIAMKLGNTTEAMEHMQQAVTLDHDYKEAVLAPVELYKQEGMAEQITDLLQTIKESGANEAVSDSELGRAYIETELFKAALKNYQDAYVFLEDDSEFLKEYGFFLSEEGLFTEALDLFTAYLKLEPLDHEVQEFVERLNDSNSF